MPSSGRRAAHWSQEPLLDAISQALAAVGEPSATPDELHRLQQEHLLDMAEQGELSASQLADSIRERRATASSGAPGEIAVTPDTAVGAASPLTNRETLQSLMLPVGGPLPDDSALARRYAVSRVLAAELAADLSIWEQITRFRHEALGDSVLAWEDVERWVANQRQHDGQPGYWLSDVPLSAEHVARGTETAAVGYTTVSLTISVPLPPPWASPAADAGTWGMGILEQRFLEYLLPGHTNSARTFVAVGGVLDGVRRLADYLASETVRPWWSKAQAATFVLTGLVPFVAVYKGLEYVIDPLLPLNQLVEQVAQLRRSLVGERAREMDRKHIHLAVFAAERSEEPWATRMKAWNETYLHWAYPEKQKSNFIRDTLAARRRLLLQER